MEVEVWPDEYGNPIDFPSRDLALASDSFLNHGFNQPPSPRSR
jgi:hypothetical protein